MLESATQNLPPTTTSTKQAQQSKKDAMNNDHNTSSSGTLEQSKVLRMLEACSSGNIQEIESLLAENVLLACQQNPATGKSPLMAAAEFGHFNICSLLLQKGAPWNAVDRQGQCAGNYATDKQHWEVVNLLVDEGTKAELILGASIRLERETSGNNGEESSTTTSTTSTPVEHEPSTKPNYLRQRLTYNSDKTALLDSDEDAVMMEWERPLMEAHASILTCGDVPGKRILNVGFGMGIIDAALQKHNPALHIIIEAHPDVYKKMVEEGWNTRPNVRLCFGKWQEVIPLLIQEGVVVDGIFYDTYAESFLDLEDFHSLLPRILQKPNGVYSFFNGLAPDNLFFHGVACQCVKLQLASMGLESEFIRVEISSPQKEEWNGIRRKYWHGRDTYYLPRITWKQEEGDASSASDKKIKATTTQQHDNDTGTNNAKRLKIGNNES